METMNAAEKPPQTGDPAPDVELLDTEGRAVSLSTAWGKRPAVVVFLRHLACTFCRQQLAWLRRDFAEFQAAGVDVVCIAQGSPKVGKAYFILYDLPFPLLLCGDDLDAYRRWGLLRGTGWDLFKPLVLLRAITAFLQGHIQTKIEGDAGQLGGGFVVDCGGVVRYVYRSRDMADTVVDAKLLDAARRVGQAPS